MSKDIPPLAQLAATHIKGYKHAPAMKFAKTGNPDALETMGIARNLTQRINTVGRVPPIRPSMNPKTLRYDNEFEVAVYGQQGATERITGKFRGETRFLNATSEGAVFRADSFAFPEAYWCTLITWEELENVMAQRPEE